MSAQDGSSADAWCWTQENVDLDGLARSESLFALSNGHIGLRGNLDEGEPCDLPGSYLNGFYETWPLPSVEAGYGDPESGQTMINVTNGKLIRLLVDDEPLDLRYGTVHRHRRRLDFRAGLLERDVEWSSPSARRIRVRSWRLVSLTQRAVAAIEYTVEPVEGLVRLVLQSELVANESQPAASRDPRVAAALQRPLEAVSHHRHDDRHAATLLHHTRRSGLQMGAGMTHQIDCDTVYETELDVESDEARLSVICELEPGQRLRVVKFVAYGWSAPRSPTALRDQVAAALAGAVFSGWAGLLAQQRTFLDAFWSDADVVVEGDPALQQAVRFGLFQVMQNSARAERRALPSKGLTGNGYDGHTFWDSEGFVLPLLTHVLPQAARDALYWRHSTLAPARRRADQLGLRGAAFPWRTIAGQECSGYWPASTAAFHLNADIAAAVHRYAWVTGDDAFVTEVGLELLVETARLWLSLGHRDVKGQFRLPGVTGPDEYSAVADDNVFTNLMAAQNLRCAAFAVRAEPERAGELGCAVEEAQAWLDAADAVFVPFDAELGVHPQAAGFTSYARWDFDAFVDRYPLFLHAPYVQLYRHQVVKQADLVLAMHWCGDRFSAEQKARNVDYYEQITVRDSSLSAATQAVLCAEVGHLDLAYDYAREAALVDLLDLHHNTGDGLHLASLAGSWSALVEGFGGLRHHGGRLRLDPALPSRLTRLRFSLRCDGHRLRVDLRPEQVRYVLLGDAGTRLGVLHAGEEVELTAGVPVVRRLRPRTPLLPPPRPPVGREPVAPEG